MCEFNVGTFTYESGPGDYEDFPYTDEPVYILGQIYSAQYDRDELKDDIRSRIWVTYRRNFPYIGGSGPSSDQGWGCMLRCGQMMLAQALLLRHVGRAWRWKPEVKDERYMKLLRMFEDKKSAIYSIHQIALMGESEGKNVGQWFGPNTIAQVLKKISVYDQWSGIHIHVALDNVVVIDEIRAACTAPCVTTGDIPGLPDDVTFSDFVNRGSSVDQTANCSSSSKPEAKPSDSPPWRPLLLIVPLRLGLTDINPIYFESIKMCFGLPQSVGIVGGKPNHAHWFIGCTGGELVYLDPHTTQPTVDLSSGCKGSDGPADMSYHCLTPPSRMAFSKLDPSIALGFYCATERDFLQLCDAFTHPTPGCPAMFEVRKDAPPAWPDCQPAGAAGGRARTVSLSDFADVPGEHSSSGLDDEEFEII